MHVIDLEGNEYPLQATVTNNYELNGNQSLSMRILPTKVNQQFIADLTEMWSIVDHDDVEYKIIYFRRKGEGSSQTVNIRAIPLFFDDFKSQRIYERYDEHMTANACFNTIFEGSGYGFILNGNFTAQNWEGFGEGDDKLTLFKDALNRYEAEFRIEGNTVYIENLIGRDTQFMYRYRLNASNIVQENDATDMYTYARGYGDYGDGEGGEDWRDANLIREYTSPLADIPGIGKRDAPPIKNGNITDQSTMDEQLKTLVDESLKISVSATLHDLRKQNYPLAQPRMGDRVFLIDERIGLSDEVRVVDMTIVKDWKGNVKDISLTFGTPNIVRRHQSELDGAINSINRLVEGSIKLPFSVLDNAVAQATKALQDAQTELSFSENGILAVDKNDPNLVTLFNSAGLGVSDDGGATFKQSITGHGVVADTIIGNLLIGQNLLIESENRQVQINGSGLDTYSGNYRTSHLDGSGHSFFRDGYGIGRIGTGSWSNVPNTRGLSFQLENDARYMAWSHRDHPDDSVYNIKLSWLAENISGSNHNAGFNFNDNVEIIGYHHFRSLGIWSNTYTEDLNRVNVSSSGTLRRITSSRRYKLLEEPIPIDYAKKILDLDVKSWFDEATADNYSKEIETGLASDEGDKIRRIPGTIAEDVHEIGLDMFVGYDDEGRPDNVSGQLPMLLLPVFKDFKKHMEEELSWMRSQITKLKGDEGGSTKTD